MTSSASAATRRSTRSAFIADGDYLGDAGFNSAGAYNRLVTFNATADANGRSAYTNSVTSGGPSVALNPTDVLRAGTFPVQRVQSSGAAISALLADTASPEVINFIFSASLPTAAQQTQAANQGWGYLHVVEIGTDSVEIAVDSTTTDAPSGLSAAELLGIYTGTYTKWNQLPGNSGGSSDTIIPLIPPSGSSIYKTFIADLTTANGGTAPTLASSVKTVEQNDPTAITGPTPPRPMPSCRSRRLDWPCGTPATSTTRPRCSRGARPRSRPGSSCSTGPPVTVERCTPARSPTTSSSGRATPRRPRRSSRVGRATGSRPCSPTRVGRSRSSRSRRGQALIAASGVTPVYNDLGDVS